MRFWLAIVLALSGCGPAPVSKLSSSAPAPSPLPSQTALSPEGVTVEEMPSSPSIAQDAGPASAPTPSNKFEGYTEAYRAVQQGPAPQAITGGDGIPDPNAISASLGDLGARVGRLKAEKDALEQTLSPAEKGQWKAYQRSLSSEGE